MHYVSRPAAARWVDLFPGPDHVRGEFDPYRFGGVFADSLDAPLSLPSGSARGLGVAGGNTYDVSQFCRRE